MNNEKLTKRREEIIKKHSKHLEGLDSNDNIIGCAMFIENTLHINKDMKDPVPDMEKRARDFYEHIMKGCGAFTGVQVPDHETWEFSENKAIVSANAYRLHMKMDDDGNAELTIDSIKVPLRSRSLNAKISEKLVKELSDAHGINMVDELFVLLMRESVEEVTREMYHRIQMDIEKTQWSYGDYTPPEGLERVLQQERFRTLYTEILTSGENIARKTRRGAGHSAIVSPKVAVALQSMGEFSQLPKGVNNFGLTISKIGTVSDHFRVYRNCTEYEDKAIVFYKGINEADAGLILVLGGIKFTRIDNDIRIMIKYGIEETGAKDFYHCIEADFSIKE